MADTTPGLSAIPEDASVKEGSKGKAIVANESVLAQMQDLYKQKQAEKNYFLQDLADASAWWSGGAAGPTAGLAQRAVVRNAQDKQLQDLQASIAGQQNAIQNRDIFFGNLSGLPASSQQKTQDTSVNPAQAKAGAAEMNQRTGGVLGLVKNSALQMAIGAEYLRDPDKGMTALVSHIASEAKTPEKLKELKALFDSGALKPGTEAAAMAIGILGSGTFGPTDTLTGAGFTTKTTPMNVAGNFTSGNTATPAIVNQPAPAVANQPAPAVANQPAPAVANQPAPTTANQETVTKPAVVPSAPVVTNQPAVTKPTTTPLAGGNVNQAQADVLGGLIPPGTKEAGEAITKKVLSNIDVAAVRPKTSAAEVGKAEGQRQAALENIRTDINNKKGQATTLLNILDETPEAVGLAYKNKAMGYLLKGAEAGMIPGIGGKKDLEEVAAVSLSPKARANRAMFDSVATNIASEVRREMAKGTGAVSNYETSQFEKAAGLSTKNPAETNKYFAIFFAETIRAKEKQLQKLDQYIKEGKTFDQFERSEDYKQIQKEWNDRLQYHFPQLKGNNLQFGDKVGVVSNPSEEEGWKQRYGAKK